MTINATAPWLFALYIAAAERQGAARGALAGTVQNDIIKEYLSRGTYIFPPEPSLRLSADVIAFAYREVPKWNPTNVCSYHLQEAGATPVQELAFALAIAIAILDAVKATGQVPDDEFAQVVGRISFFVNAGIRFITEICKMRAFAELWDELCRERWGIADEKLRRFRYGVQVNSLGLTEQQPENNVYRILLEMLAVTLSKRARARAVQLPAWNEALGLPRPWDQQWSLRLQQILAYETDLLDYEDIFDGSAVIEAKVEALKAEATGGAGAHRSPGRRRRRRRAELYEAQAGGIQQPAPRRHRDRRAEGGRGELLHRERALAADRRIGWRIPRRSIPRRSGRRSLASRPGALPATARPRPRPWPRSKPPRATAATSWSLPSPAPMPASPPANGRAALREIYGEYRAPTGVGRAATIGGGTSLAPVREAVERVSARLGRRLKMLVGKPGLDGHSNGAEQIAVRARDAGFEVVYEGIRLTPAQIANAALEEGVHVVGLSILSGSHVALVSEVLVRLKAAGLGAVPVVVGGIIPPEDAAKLSEAGVARVYTPKDYDLNAIMADIVALIDQGSREAA